MSIQTAMTAIADKLRALLGLSGAMGLDAMAANLETEQINVSNAFSAVSNKGGTMPALQISGNLAAAIGSIPSSTADGIIEISQNGLQNVSGYASARVNVTAESIAIPKESCSGSGTLDDLSSFAKHIGWRPESVTLQVNGSLFRFPNLSDYADGTLLMQYDGNQTVFTDMDAFYAAVGDAGDVTTVAVIISAYGFVAEFYIDGSNYTSIPGSTVDWICTVNPEQSRAIPMPGDDFIRADGNRLRTANGDAWVCRSMNARLNLILGTTEEEEQRAADWELSQEAYNEIAALGFNTIKLLWSAHFFESDAAPYVYRSEAWEWIDQQITWAKSSGLKIILNAHRPQGGAHYSGDSEDFYTDTSNQDRLVALWKAIAQRYANEPTIIGYGVLNETHLSNTGNEDDWISVIHYRHNALIQRIVDAIRTVDTNHVIFVDRALGVYGGDGYTGYIYGCYWQFAMIQDYNLCFEWHDYQPSAFTGQSSTAADAALQYPGKLYSTGDGPTTDAAWQLDYQQQLTQKVYDIYDCEKPVFIGEWGGSGIQNADDDSDLQSQFVQCFTDMMSGFNANGYGYSFHLWTGLAMGYYKTNPPAVYTRDGKRDWLTPVFTAGNAVPQTDGITDTPAVYSEINRIMANIDNAYAAAEKLGAVMPVVKNGENLADTISSIPTSEQSGINVLDFVSESDTNYTAEFSIPKQPSNFVLIAMDAAQTYNPEMIRYVAGAYNYMIHGSSTTAVNFGSGTSYQYSFANGVLTFSGNQSGSGTKYYFKTGTYRLFYWD